MKESKPKLKRDIKAFVKKEKDWSTLAKKEGQGNSKAAKREKAKGMGYQAKESNKEAKIDQVWSDKRKRQVDKALRDLAKLQTKSHGGRKKKR